MEYRSASSAQRPNVRTASWSRATSFTLILLTAVSYLSFSGPARAGDDTPPTDAKAILDAAVKAMGGTVPTDSQATGTLTITAGASSDGGTIVVLTRGLEETSEITDTGAGLNEVVYAFGEASQEVDSVKNELQSELAVTTQTCLFPLQVLTEALSNPDTAYEYIGLEDLDGIKAHHITIENTFASDAKNAALADFSVKDLWIDPATNLPLKLGHERREGGGDAPRIAVAYLYLDFRTVGDILYPFTVEKFYNGTPFAVIKFNEVLLNVGLTDDKFSVE